MKNFTNNFKQFTSRLSARWLIMALMLLLGTSSAWAVDYYLRGTFNGWLDGGMQDAYKFAGGSGTVSVNLNANTTYNFKIATSNWSEEYSNSGTMTRDNCTNWPTSKTGDCKITTDVQGQYIFTFSANKEISVQYPPLCTTCCGSDIFRVAGSSNLCGSDWKGDDDNNKMECSDDIFSKSYNITGNTSYTFKIVKNNSDWINTINSNASITNKIALKTTGNDNNVTLSENPSSNGKLTIYYDPNKGIYATFEKSCTPETSITSAELQQDGTISLAGNFTTCGAKFHGFQWRKVGSDWCGETGYANNKESNYVTIGNTDVNGSETDSFTPEDEGTYEFRTYIVTTSPWLYSTTTIEVSTCTSIPDNTYAIAGNNEWTGNANPVTINYDANTYGTPTILYDGEAQIPTDVGTYAITINVPAHNGYCASTISLGDYEITCIDVEKPAITTSATVCEGTKVNLSNYNGVNTNTVKWYSDEECNSEVTEQVTLTDNDTKYYAKAYHAASGCYSSEYSTLTFTVNPLPTISISGNNSAVLYEDVELTADTDGTSISWEITEGDGSLSSTTGNSVTLTSSSADNVTVTATATLGSCTATDTHEVEFSAENCAPVASKDIQITFTHPANNQTQGQWWGMGKMYNSSAVVLKDMGCNTSGSTTFTLTNVATSTISVYFEACYDWGYSGVNTKKATTKDSKITLYRGKKYSITITNGNIKATATATETGSLTQDPPITAPAAKTISVSTTDGEGNIIFSGQVVKTGCDATNEYGFQYSSDKQTWTTVKVGENAAAGTVISNNTVTELDGTYYVRAYITNDNSTQYGAVKKITVSTKKYPITTVTLTHVKNQAGEPYSDQELENLTYCVGDIVWFKLEQDGSNFQEYQWISCPGTGLKGMYTGGMFQFKITESGNVGIRLRNDANVDGEGNPTWIESDPLEFNTHPVAISPTISFENATICSNSTATLKLGSLVVGQSYELYKEIENEGVYSEERVGDVTLTCNSIEDDLKFTGLNESGKYFVKGYTAQCPDYKASSQTATLEIVDESSVYITLNPTEATTTPWMPVKFTVNASDKYTLNVTKGNPAEAATEAEVSQNGNNVSVKIPLPQGSTLPEGTTGVYGQYENVVFPGGATTQYTITATLSATGGDDNPCATPANATITLVPYEEECTIGH